MKKCSKCKIEYENEIENFDKHSRNKCGLRSDCKLCSKKYREKNKEKRKLYDQNRIYNYENKIQYYLNNKETVLLKEKERYSSNKEERLLKQKEYNKNNKDKRNIYLYERRKNDPLFRLTTNIRNLINNSFYKMNHPKTSKTQEILGCSFEEFKIYLESKFEYWMSWGNRGLYNGKFNYGWDVDHIIPLASATSKEELLGLNHYTNLKPLCGKINRDIKKNNIETYGII